VSTPAKKKPDDDGFVEDGFVEDAPAPEPTLPSAGPSPEALAAIARMAERPAPAGPQTTGLDAFGRGAGQGASLGFGDEMAGFGAWLAGGGKDEIPRAAGRGVDAPASDVTSYEAARDAERQANALARKEHGGAYLAGELVGGTAPAVALGAGASKFIPAITRLAPAARAGIEGAALGGVTGAGTSEADDAAGVTRDALHGAEVGGLAGAGLSMAAPYVGKAVKGAAGWVGENLGRGANTEAVAAAGPHGNDTRNLMRDFGDDALNDFGQSIRDQNLGGNAPGAGWETYAKNAEKQLAEIGPAIGAATKRADAQGVRVNSGDIVSEMLDRGAELENLPQVPAIKKQIDDLLENAVALDNAGEMSFGQAVEFRRKLDDIAWDAAAAKQSQVAKDARALAVKMRGAIDDSLKEADPDLRNELVALNQRYSTAARVHKYATTRLAKESGLQIGGLSGKLLGGAGAATGFATGGPIGAAKGAALGYATDKLVKERGHDILSKTLGAGERLANGLSRVAVKEPIQRVATDVAAEQAPAFAAMPSRQAASADDGIDDPQYGSMLAAHSPGQQRSIMYSTLLLNDPAFRERRRLRAQDEEKQEGK
jgi:hypothetical protein